MIIFKLIYIVLLVFMYLGHRWALYVLITLICLNLYFL